MFLPFIVVFLILVSMIWKKHGDLEQMQRIEGSREGEKKSLKKIYCCSITVVCLFSPSLHPTPPESTSFPLDFCPYVLYSSSCNPFSSLSPPHSPLAIFRLFLIYTLCNSMVGTGEHYAKWNKPGGEGQIPYDLTFHWNIINRRNRQTKYNQ